MNPKQKVGVVIVCSNLFLATAKGLVGWYSGSIAVQSEAFNSLVDLVYSLIIITGFLLSQRERTSEYPEGLIRLEPLVSIFVSGGILLTGSFIMYNSVQRLVFGASATQQTSLAIGVLLVSMLVKYGMYRFVGRKAREYNSPSLAATAIDDRNDVLTAGIALVGVGSFIVGLPEIEAVSAILISGYIMYSGVKVGEENIKYALGKSVSPEMYGDILEEVLTHPDVEGIHDVEIHYTGPLLDIAIHLEIEGGISIEKGHDIEIEVADRIRQVVESNDSGINEINLHLDPDSLDEWKDGHSVLDEVGKSH